MGYDHSILTKGPISMKRLCVCLCLVSALLTAGCASTRLGEAWNKGSLCQTLVNRAEDFYQDNGRYPSADSLATMTVLRLYNPKFSVYQLPNLYTAAPDNLDKKHTFLYYADRGVIMVAINYNHHTGSVIQTSGEDAALWYHTQIIGELLFKCSRGELRADQASAEIASYLSLLSVSPPDTLQATMKYVKGYSQKAINEYLRQGAFSESTTLGFSGEIASYLHEELERLRPFLRRP